MTITTKFDMAAVSDILASRGLNPGGKAQQYIAVQLVGIMDNYVPFRTGVLKGSAHRNLSPPYETIIYDGPYARRHYYNAGGTDILGRRFGPATFHEAPQRGSHWDKRAWAAHGDMFLRNLQEAVNSGRFS